MTFDAIIRAGMRVSVASTCVWFAVCGPAVAAQPPAPAAGQPAAQQAAKPSAPPSAAEQALNRGIAAYQKDAMARAIGAFSSALSTGGLDTKGIARALYYRGLAYRKQGRTALAITDLTNALWLKNGLDDAERAAALSNRAAAYKEAGIEDPGAPPAAETAAPAAPAPVTTAATPKAAAPEPAASVTPAKTASAEPSAPRAALAAEEAPASSGSSTGGLGGIGSFFSNLFSGGSSSSSSESSQTASSSTPTSSDLTTASTGASAATSSWSSSTAVSGANTSAARAPAPSAAAPRQRTAALKAPAPATQVDAAPPASVPQKGKYKLQLAAVRSRADAEQLLKRFSSEHSGKAGGRTPVIEEAVFGNMGTFYRVNIGPYASAAEPEKLCSEVRGSGFDCLVVTH